MEEVVKVQKTSIGPTGIGSTFENQVEFLRKTIEDTQEIVEYEPNKKMIIVQKTGLVPFKASYLFRNLNSGTRFSMQIEAESGGLFKIAAPLVRRQLRTQFERNLANLKALLVRR
jgi:carbon monoxide dehydrogenase subunit G